jgi:membrane protein DedA with SNARE-associated domain
LLVPGEALALASGVLAQSGALDLGGVVAAVAIGAVVGDNIGYELGRRLGRPRLLEHGDRFGVGDEMIERAERVFEQHDSKTLVLGRFVGALALIALVVLWRRRARPV